jgi:hypothetical protein
MAKFNGQLPLLCGHGIEPELIGALCYHTTIILQRVVRNNGLRISERRCWLSTRNANLWRNNTKFSPRARRAATLRELARGSEYIPVFLSMLLFFSFP